MRTSVDVEERFSALYRAHYAAVLRYASRRTDPDTARDVASETFLVAWRRRMAVPAEPDQVEPWLYGVARRVLANSDRSSRRSWRLAARLNQVAQPRQVPDPATAVAERQRLLQALRRLPARDQEALRLIGWEELDLAGAAIAMGCSRSTMSVRLHRARRRLDDVLSSIDAGDQRSASARITPAAVRQESR
jgi:RNA polymerase sigma factor (sigma-70 family)